jgi:toxin FitB
VLPVDAAVVARLAKLGYADVRDGLLAATALEQGLTIVTRDRALFKAGRVRTLDPWEHRAEAEPENEGDWRQASRSAPVWLKSLFVRG